MMQLRTIVEERQKNVVVMDVFSKLVQERIIFIDDIINDELANGIIAQMLYLDSLDQKKPINLYINTPGGNVCSGLAIYDIAEKINAPIRTVAMGQCCSMGVPLLLMGSERCATKRSRIMIHQVSTISRGKLSDVQLDLKEADILQKTVYEIIAEKTGKSYAQIMKDGNSDFWMGAEEALEYGLITKIL